MEIEEAPTNNVKAFANWPINSDSWFLIGWRGFSHVWESRFAIVMYEFFMRSILSENLNKYEIKPNLEFVIIHFMWYSNPPQLPLSIL